MKRMLCLIYPLMLISTIGLSLPKVDAPAPDFKLTAEDGKTYSLKDFKGKTVVLEWWNYKCPFVKKHYESGNMQKLQKDYTAKDVVWLVINSSAPGKQGHVKGKEASDIMAKKNAHPSKILLDPKGKVGHLYGAKTTPHMYVINSQGNLVYKGAIDDKPTPSKADIKGAKNYVQLALNATMKGKPVSVNKTRPYGCAVKYK